MEIRDLYLYAEVAAFLIGCYLFNSLKKGPSVILVFLLAYVLATEQFGRYFRRVLHKPNVEFYNLSTAIEFMVYFYLFSIFFKKSWKKKYSKYLLWIYPIIWLINILFIQGFHIFHTYSMTIGSIAIIILSCLYLQELIDLALDKDITQHAPFWLCTGLIFFYTGGLVNDFIISNTYKIYFTNLRSSLYSLINNILNVILYSGYIMYFICYHRNKNISSL